MFRLCKKWSRKYNNLLLVDLNAELKEKKLKKGTIATLFRHIFIILLYYGNM